MERFVSILIIVLLGSSLSFGQTAAQKKSAAEKKAADQRSRSLGGQITDNDLKDDRGKVRMSKGQTKVAEDSVKLKNKDKLVVQPNEDQPNGAHNAAGKSKAEKANAPSVIQSTSSESGSPSILSSDDGKGRDGTNNVQRASFNTAGAQVSGNLGLDKKNQSDKMNSKNETNSADAKNPQTKISGNAGKQSAKSQQPGSSKQTQAATKNSRTQSDKSKSKSKSRKNSGK